MPGPTLHRGRGRPRSRVTLLCVCGRRFERPPSALKRSRAAFCSHLCRARAGRSGGWSAICEMPVRRCEYGAVPVDGLCGKTAASGMAKGGKRRAACDRHALLLALAGWKRVVALAAVRV